jgi:cytochrome P450
MPQPSPARCPFDRRAEAAPEAAPEAARGAWPPGPRTRFGGWSLLPRLSRDLLGTLGEWQRTFGDLVHLRLWPEHEIVVTNPEYVRELLVTHHDALIRWERGLRIFAQLHGHSVLIAEGDAWRHKRQALQPSFSPKAVQAFLPTVAEATGQALAQWPTGAADWPIEGPLTSLTMDVIMQLTFSSHIGSDARVAEDAIRTASAAANAEFFWPASWPDWVPWKRAKRRAIASLHALIDRHVQTRLASPPQGRPDDLLGRLLALHETAPSSWPLAAVRDECMTSFLAGHETTATTLIWWAWCMAAHPEAQARARAEVEAVLRGEAPTAETLPSLAYLGQTIRETLRLYPSVPAVFTRRSTAPITLGGWTLPAGTMFLIPTQLMHSDPRLFEAPASFRPERFAGDAPQAPRGAFMPFGTGPRVCLGQHLALAEATAIAAMLLQRFALSVPDGAAAPEPAMQVTLRPKVPLRLGLRSSKPPSARVKDC